MGNLVSSGLIAIVVLISFLLLGSTVLSVIPQVTTGGTTDDVTEEDLQKMVNEAIIEISSYLQIKDQIGKYYPTEGTQKIQKIALLISPLFSQEINVSQLTIKLSTKDTVMMLSYDGYSENIGSNTLFEHPMWSYLTGYNYGFIVINDQDNALLDYNVLNKDTDMVYVVFKLPENMYLLKHDSITVTLFPSSGITRITELEAPLPIKSVITFE